MASCLQKIPFGNKSRARNEKMMKWVFQAVAIDRDWIRKTDEILPDNYLLSKNQLINLEKQLDRNKKRFAYYDKIIQDYIKERIVERIDHFDNNTILGRAHYLPHRGVAREDHDTTKLRIVFDALARIRNELCLNDILYSRPCLLPYLYDILLWFRTGKIGLVRDIK